MSWGRQLKHIIKPSARPLSALFTLSTVLESVSVLQNSIALKAVIPYLGLRTVLSLTYSSLLGCCI